MDVFESETLGKEAVYKLYTYMNWRLYPRLLRFWHPTMLDAIMEQYQTSPLYRDITLLVRVANGEFAREEVSEDFVLEIVDTILQVREDFGHPPYGPLSNDLPDELTRQPLWQMLQRAQYWVWSPTFMTLSEAASLYTGRPTDQASLMAIQSLIRKWQRGNQRGLEVWIDPFEPNPQRNKRVRREDVEKLKAAREQKQREQPARRKIHRRKKGHVSRGETPIQGRKQ